MSTTKIKGIKNDFKDHKLRWDLLPLQEIEDVVKVYTAGAEKYGPNKWQYLEDGYNRYKAALFRHLLEYEKGNEIDEETGCRHVAQVVWNAIAMLYYSKQKDKKKMNERWALKAIAEGELVWENKVFDIVKTNYNYCDDCYFNNEPVCPHQICNSTGGGILVLNKLKTKELATKDEL